MRIFAVPSIAVAIAVIAAAIAGGCSGDDASPSSQAAKETSLGAQIRRSALAGLGKLAFVASVNGQSDVYVIDASGRVRNLTRDAATDYDVSWSPDGKRIAFSSDREGSPDVFVANADGSGVRRLTDLPTIEHTPSWSPDGTKITFGLATADESTFAIYVLDVDGGEAKKLTEKKSCYVGDPDWSPDGAHIALDVDCAGGGQIDIYVINADGTGVRQLTDASGDDGTAAWSPDGNRIAFHSDRGQAIYTMKPDGSDERKVSPNLPFEDARLDWAPEGNRLVYVSESGGDIYVLTLGREGSKPALVTNGILVTSVSVTDR